ncbi:hypothetical protein Dfri01_48520 [Dyadobacter frigoris]|uniref:AraC family transcriptional regulator n=1 Tax=Dyadobacter frigoris TaxID=2576211 RepID=UPI0024A5A49A|nr:helix-turn-helix domain-containing protein [Dyadobacter frigoris]GLU55391.1 hypothetical protein Dfri01_48520 [Dyadobacter frigoris]
MYNPLLTGLAGGGSFLLAFLLFKHPKDNNLNANRWLGVFVISFAFSLLEIFVHDLGLQNVYPKAMILMELSRFLAAPTLYLSVAYFTAPAKTFTWKFFWHFLPFLFFLSFQLPRIVTGNNVEIPDKMLARIIFTIFAAAFPVQISVYWILSYRKLHRHKQNINQMASSTESINLLWLTNFLYVVVAIVLIWLNLAIFRIPGVFDYTPAFYLVSIYFLAYYSLKQKEIYAYPQQTLKELEVIINQDTAIKTEKQKRLSDTQTNHLKGKLEKLMDKEKVYLNNELSLPALAKRMEISIHELSFLINDVYGENFFSFVNRYRVEEAKGLLLSDNADPRNMLDIAFESGFNSKTSFNTSFKKLTGLSPTDFLRSFEK